MNASEDRQLEAEADAYQMEDDSRRERDKETRRMQTEIDVLRAMVESKTKAMFAWERTARYERAVRSRLERAIEFHKLQTPMSGPMLDDLQAAKHMADERWADAHAAMPKEIK